MMLTTSVAAAIRSDSFSKSVTHITPTKGVNRHSPVAGFIIAHRFFTGKNKTEQIFVCSLFMSSFCLRHLHVYFINVAVSRARDQLWILHSFPASALKGDDIRSKLLNYAANPHAADSALPQIRQMTGSSFEEAMAKTLVEHGYDIVQQWSVGHYRIDIVVRDGAKKIALECDGDRWHSGAEKVYEDMERQMILERLGWQFIRLRGSTYYRDPGKAMRGVMHELEAHDIHPAVRAETSVSSDLVEEVRRRVEALLAEKKE